MLRSRDLLRSGNIVMAINAIDATNATNAILPLTIERLGVRP